MNHVSSSFFSPLITQGAYREQVGCRHSGLGERRAISDICTTASAALLILSWLKVGLISIAEKSEK